MKRMRCLFTAAALGAGIFNFQAATVTFEGNWGGFSGPFTVLPNIAGGNSPDNLFTNAAWGTFLGVWDTQAQGYSVFGKPQFGCGCYFYPQGAVLDVQSGFFLNYTGQTFTWIIPDDLPPPPSVLNLETNKYYLRGPMFYGHSRYEDIVGAPPRDETSLFRYIGGPSGEIYPPKPPSWQAYHFVDGAWTPSEPVLDPLEAAFMVYPTLRIRAAITVAPPVMVLTWPRGELEVAGQPTGPWQTVTNAQAPFVVDLGFALESSRFYRVREWP